MVYDAPQEAGLPRHRLLKARGDGVSVAMRTSAMVGLSPRAETSLMRPFERFVNLLTVAAHERGLRRMGDREVAMSTI